MFAAVGDGIVSRGGKSLRRRRKLRLEPGGKGDAVAGIGRAGRSGVAVAGRRRLGRDERGQEQQDDDDGEHGGKREGANGRKLKGFRDFRNTSGCV